jgi:hypothetical protein
MPKPFNNQLNNKPEDIFSQANDPKLVNQMTPPQINKEARLKQMLAQVDQPSSENFRLGIILLAVLLIVLIVIFGVYFFRSREASNNNVLSSSTTNNNPTTILDKIVGTNINQTKGQDTDQDGLTDDEEINVYKTDPSKADTDGDGLTDREEVKVYKTNPLKADTDGDGLSDGLEIKNHHDPLNPDPQAIWPPKVK